MSGEFSGREIGDFLLQEPVARRTTMELYRAMQESLKRFALVKIISLNKIAHLDPTLVDDVQHHIQQTVGVEHMHLQPLYGYGFVDENHIYVAGRFIGGSVYDLLRVGALPLSKSIDLMLQAVSALEFIDKQGYLHTSLSPYNLYIGEDDNLYLNDLELAPIVQRAKSLQDFETLLDAPFYAPVEQLQLVQYDVRSEIYSVGAILYHMITGKPPFADSNNGFERVLERKVRGNLIQPRFLNVSVPPELETLIQRCLHPDPNQRYADFNALDAALRQVSNVLDKPNTSLLDNLRRIFSRRRSS